MSQCEHSRETTDPPGHAILAQKQDTKDHNCVVHLRKHRAICTAQWMIIIFTSRNLNYVRLVPVPSLLQKHLCQTRGGSENNALGHLVRHAHERRVRAVHGVRDIATWELSRHRLLSCEWDCLVLLGEEKADLDTVVPGLVCVVVGEDTGGLGLESGEGFLDKGLVRNISVEDLASVDRSDEFTLQYYLTVSSSGVPIGKEIKWAEGLTEASGLIHGRYSPPRASRRLV